MSGESAMSARRNSLFCLAAAVVLTLTAVDTAWRKTLRPGQNSWPRPNPWANAPSPKNGAGKTNSYSRGSAPTTPEAIVPIPSMVLRGGQYIDNGAIPDGLQAPSPSVKAPKPVAS